MTHEQSFAPQHCILTIIGDLFCQVPYDGHDERCVSEIDFMVSHHIYSCYLTCFHNLKIRFGLALPTSTLKRAGESIFHIDVAHFAFLMLYL